MKTRVCLECFVNDCRIENVFPHTILDKFFEASFLQISSAIAKKCILSYQLGMSFQFQVYQNCLEIP